MRAPASVAHGNSLAPQEAYVPAGRRKLVTCDRLLLLALTTAWLAATGRAESAPPGPSAATPPSRLAPPRPGARRSLPRPERPGGPVKAMVGDACSGYRFRRGGWSWWCPCYEPKCAPPVSVPCVRGVCVPYCCKEPPCLTLPCLSGKGPCYAPKCPPCVPCPRVCCPR